MKKVPEFKSEAEEFEFWWTVDSTEYVDWSRASRSKFAHLKRTPINEKSSDVAGPERV
jgi:hypothetical protein